MTRSTRTGGTVAAFAAAASLIAGCTSASTQATSGGVSSSPAAPGDASQATSGTTAPAKNVTIQYALWEDPQLPAYQACADAFHAQNPNITVKVTNTAWGQYWQNLDTEMAAGTAPDVFADSVSYYPDLVANNQILDISSYVQRDGVDLGQYRDGLADLWVKDGKRYGLPKDWDAVAMVYNTSMLSAAGVDPAALSDLTWNPTDGGTFGKLIAHLTVDANGVRGDQPGFNKSKIKTYGLVLDLDAGDSGQTSWGNLAESNGFQFLDKNPFGTHYNYSDPSFVSTISWINDLQAEGYMPRYDQHSSLGTQAVLESGTAAIGLAGSWMADTYLTDAKQKFAYAPLPVGPAGRKTETNDLSDAIYAGSKHKEEAWAWVKFLASPQCQDIVASKAVVLPAVKTSSDKAMAAYEAKGEDLSVFSDEVSAPNGTFLLPLTDHAADIGEIVQNALDTVWLGQASPQSAMTKANDAVNALFK